MILILSIPSQMFFKTIDFSTAMHIAHYTIYDLD